MPAPSNLKVIKPEEIRAVMESFAMGTGLKCLDCHVEGDFGSDEKNKKVVARKMLTMVRGITSIPSTARTRSPTIRATAANRIRNRLLSSAADPTWPYRAF